MKGKSPFTAERLSVNLEATDVAQRNESFGCTDTKGRELGMYVCTGTVAVGPGPVGYAGYDLRGGRPFCGGTRLPVGVHYFARLQPTRGGQKFGAYQPEYHFTSESARDEYVAKRLRGAQRNAEKIGVKDILRAGGMEI